MAKKAVFRRDARGRMVMVSKVSINYLDEVEQIFIEGDCKWDALQVERP